MDAPSSYNGVTYSYDSNGSQVTTSANQLRSFDPEGRMQEVHVGISDSQFVYDANGQRLLKITFPTRTAPPNYTLYVGGYEEELNSGAYTVYYSFGGKGVGLRRGSQGSSNGQYRMVGDHLGGTTLLIDCGNTPQVVQRQYYKPYGEIGWSWSAAGSLTSIGFTGQRLDSDSGLMYYGARFYDPALSYFVSADTQGVSKGAAQSRNRYAYVLNNPLNVTDPTGHDPQCVNQDCEKEHAATTLRQFGFKLNAADWTLDQLNWMIEAINDLLQHAHKMGYDFDSFRDLMGIGEGQSVDLIKIDPSGIASGAGTTSGIVNATQCGPMCTDGNGQYIAINPIVAEERYKLLKGPRDEFGRWFRFAFVHELGHLMDARHEHKYSQGMQTGAAYCSSYPYCLAELPISPRAKDGQEEEWAESVAEFVYPGYGFDVNGSNDPTIGPQHRRYGAMCVDGRRFLRDESRNHFCPALTAACVP